MKLPFLLQTVLMVKMLNAHTKQMYNIKTIVPYKPNITGYNNYLLYFNSDFFHAHSFFV